MMQHCGHCRRSVGHSEHCRRSERHSEHRCRSARRWRRRDCHRDKVGSLCSGTNAGAQPMTSALSPSAIVPAPPMVGIDRAFGAQATSAQPQRSFCRCPRASVVPGLEGGDGDAALALEIFVAEVGLNDDAMPTQRQRSCCYSIDCAERHAQYGSRAATPAAGSIGREGGRENFARRIVVGDEHGVDFPAKWRRRQSPRSERRRSLGTRRHERIASTRSPPR